MTLTGDQLNKSHYGERLEKKITFDFRLAQDPEFRNRYTDDYEFVKVPKFRQDARAWEAFVRTWTETVALQLTKGQPRSLIAKLIRSAIGAGADPTAAKIGKELRSRWSSNEVGDTVWVEWEDGFHQGKISRNLKKELVEIKFADGDQEKVSTSEIYTLGRLLNWYDDNLIVR